MKILWSGSLYHPTGFGNHSRGMVKALLKLGHQVQSDDYFIPRPDLDISGLEKINCPIVNSLNELNKLKTVINDYPNNLKGHGEISHFLIHEGTKLHPNWIPVLNSADKVLVPSKATKNLAKWNNITKPVYIVPEGINPNFYAPYPEHEVAYRNEEFTFTFVGAWTGEFIDRKGAGLVIKAFHEEFQKENVKLYLKNSTFWMAPFDVNKAIFDIIKSPNENIEFNDKPITPTELRKIYWNSDCFVMPTMGESFGLTVAEAMACGVPVIITKDKNSGHMDFTKDFVNYINWKDMINGNPRFYTNGNMFPLPELEDLKKQMRYVYENYKDSKKRALEGSKFIRENFTWKKAAERLIEVLNESPMS